MPEGYCTLQDLKRAPREASLPGDLEQEPQITVDAIVSQIQWLERTYKRHRRQNSDALLESVRVDDHLDEIEAVETSDTVTDAVQARRSEIGEG